MKKGRSERVKEGRKEGRMAEKEGVKEGWKAEKDGAKGRRKEGRGEERRE